MGEDIKIVTTNPSEDLPAPASDATDAEWAAYHAENLRRGEEKRSLHPALTDDAMVRMPDDTGQAEEETNEETGETVKFFPKRTSAGPGQKVKVSEDGALAKIEVYRGKDKSGERLTSWEDLKHGARIYNNPSKDYYKRPQNIRFSGAWFWDENKLDFVRTDPSGAIESKTEAVDILLEGRYAEQKFASGKSFPSKAAYDLPVAAEPLQTTSCHHTWHGWQGNRGGPQN